MSTVLLVITDLHVGGVPLHLRRLAHALRSRGYRPVVASLARAGAVGDMLREEGFDVRHCGACCGWDVRVFRRLTKVIRSVRPDVIHSVLFHANLAARYAAKGAGYPPQRVLCEIQTVEVERRWHLWVDRLTYRRCRCIIGNSPSVVDHLRRRAGIPGDRLRLVRGGIDPGPYESAAPIRRESLSMAGDARLVLWVGRLDPVKGLRELIQAFRVVADRDHVHLLLAGEGAMRSTLERDIRAHDLQDRVHLLGERHDIPALLKASDVFVFPSRTEGLPNALLEAMAASCPIVTTDVPGCRDLIVHERTGLILPYGDTPALAQAILRLFDDAELARRLGFEAHAVVTQSWHQNAMWDAYATLYEEIRAGDSTPDGRAAGASGRSPALARITGDAGGETRVDR